ncbi:hypothetical protein ACIRG5_04705 [Lentzea sp. NPDC102401]
MSVEELVRAGVPSRVLQVVQAFRAGLLDRERLLGKDGTGGPALGGSAA